VLSTRVYITLGRFNNNQDDNRHKMQGVKTFFLRRRSASLGYASQSAGELGDGLRGAFVDRLTVAENSALKGEFSELLRPLE
jgi:hypothetical protein